MLCWRLGVLGVVGAMVHGCASDGGGGAGMPGEAGPLVELDRLLEEEERAGCECHFADDGYASVEECVADLELPPLFDVGCLERTWPDHAAALGPEIECMNAAQREGLDCAAVAACDESAEDVCNEAALEALLSCPAASEDDWAAFERQYERCAGR